MKSTTTRSILTAVAIVLSLTALMASQSIAGQSVAVQLQSGRQFNAEVHERTNDQRLWLAFRTRSAELLRPVAWERIVTAEFEGETFTGDELRKHLQTVEVSFNIQDRAANEDQSSDTPETIPAPTGEADRTLADEAHELLFSQHRLPNHRVASVQFDVHLANWDGDVEADGLIVHVIPVNSTGHVVAANGHVNVELHAARRIAFQDGQQKRGRRIDRIGRWVQQLNTHCFDARGYWFKLPFQADHPEFDTDLGTSGLVHVKLVIPGDGVFESSIDGVRVRPFAPLRDDLQQVEGRRFLANERTGRGVRVD